MRYFTIKNFRKFQHYKDRCPPWIKLHRSLLDDYEFTHLLPDDSAHQLIRLWLFASQKMDPEDITKEVELPLDPDWLKNQIKIKGKMNLKPLFQHGFLIMTKESEMLHNAEQDDTETSEKCTQRRGENINHTEKEKSENAPKETFSDKWKRLPSAMKVGRADSEKIYNRKVKIRKQEEHYDMCWKNYFDKVKHDQSNGFPTRKWLNGKTWFNHYEDYEERVVPEPITAINQRLSV